MKTLSRTSSWIALLIGVVTAVLFVALDLFVECMLLPEPQQCMDLLYHPTPARLWTRLLGVGIILLVGLLSLILLRRHENTEARLAHSSFLLEELAVELKQKNAALSREIALRKVMEKELETLAVTDQLTGIYNRRKFDEILHMHIRQETRYPKGLALLILDLDHFKTVNDHFGHHVGDDVLREFVNLVASAKRQADDLFRVGGEEFCLITFSNNGGSLQTTADKICEAVANHTFPVAGHITVSIGVTRFVPEDSYDSLFKRADDALYLAKKRGRNQVVIL